MLSIRSAIAFPLLCVATMILCSGCGLWQSTNKPITSSDLDITDPFDGSKVYPLNVVVLGSSQQKENGNINKKFSLLESRMREEGSQYAVMRAADCGMLACYANKTKLAARALDRAILLSQRARADESLVSKVSGVAGSERNKLFAGEPHEIAALHVFRGLVFLADNNPENAKSCFLQASLEDAMASQDIDRANWLTADILTVLAFRLYESNVRANDHIDMIKKAYPQFVGNTGLGNSAELSKIKRNNLTIIIVAIGNPPIKYGRGSLEYADSESKVKTVLVQGSSAWLTDDVYIQAVTRGRRNMDGILQAREQSRKNTQTAGAVALHVASAVGGLVGSAIQLIAGAIIDKSQEIDVDADSRQINAIPGQFHVLVSNSFRAGETLTIELQNSISKPIACGAISIPKSHNDVPRVILAWFPR